MELKRNMGITLIALIITIIVMLILAGVSLNAIVGDNGILTNATKAASATTYANYLEELQITLVSSGDTPTVVGESLKNYISSISDSDLENFMILKGELYYIGSSNSEAEAAEMVGISTDLSGGSASEVITIINSVIVLEDNYIGTELLDKNALNSETWKLAIDYNSSNVEVARYGTGYYLLMPDTEYTIDEKTVTFSDYYVIDYENQVLISSNSIVYWDIDSTLAVSDGLVLNIDPTNMADIDYTVETGNVDEFDNTEYDLQIDGVSTEIMKYGDVEYDSDNSALLFNESENNENGEGGYLTLTRSNVDFEEGFTFEIYANLSRISYDNGSGATSSSGMFCRIPTLQSTCTQSLRFGSSGATICKFNTSSSWEGIGSVLKTASYGDVAIGYNAFGYSTGVDFYLTFVYTVYDESKTNDYEDDEKHQYMIENEVDLVEYYINGELYGYTYYGNDSYQQGLDTWNNDDCPFFLGVCPWQANGNLYYLKGTVYTCRLYTTSFTEEQVEESYNTTLKYRNSFT